MEELFGEFESLLYRLAKVIGPRATGKGQVLPVPQYMLLRTLRREGDSRVSDIAGHLGVKNPAASMLVQVCVASGLVKRSSDPNDRRATLISLSKKGADRLSLAEEQRIEFMRGLSERLPDEDLNTMIRGLNVVVDAVDDLQG